MLTRWMSGSSPVRYLRNSATLFSRAATSPRFSSSLRLARAARLVVVPLNLFTRLHRCQAWIQCGARSGLLARSSRRHMTQAQQGVLALLLQWPGVPKAYDSYASQKGELPVDSSLGAQGGPGCQGAAAAARDGPSPCRAACWHQRLGAAVCRQRQV